jgi:hypothetical protein
MDFHPGWLTGAVIDKPFDDTLDSGKGEVKIQSSGGGLWEQPCSGDGSQLKCGAGETEGRNTAQNRHSSAADGFS